MKPLLFLFFGVILFSSCNPTSCNDMDEKITKNVLDHHWEAFVNNDLEEVMKDYSEASILITPDATYKGLDEIRQNFINAFVAFPIEESTLTLNKTVVEEDIGYILWEADVPQFNLSYATDSFQIRGGKILRQTFAGMAEPK